MFRIGQAGSLAGVAPHGGIARAGTTMHDPGLPVGTGSGDASLKRRLRRDPCRGARAGTPPPLMERTSRLVSRHVAGGLAAREVGIVGAKRLTRRMMGIVIELAAPRRRP